MTSIRHKKIDTANADTSVSFWDGMLSGFRVNSYDIPVTQFPKLRDNLTTRPNASPRR